MSNSINCRYCGAVISVDNRFCPNCGAANPEYVTPGRSVVIPATIEELKDYCRANNIPLSVIHFHIGEDFRKPRAIGIYQDGSEFVVYKNKDDGSRFIRYRGTDEAYAVREIYLKLREVLENFAK
jgi:uncharacterized OB-fold protein